MSHIILKKGIAMCGVALMIALPTALIGQHTRPVERLSLKTAQTIAQAPEGGLNILRKEGRVFIHYKMKPTENEGILALERSIGGQDFQVVSIRPYFESPVKLLYCFEDIVPVKGDIAYRIRIIRHGEYPLLSEVKEIQAHHTETTSSF